MSTKFRFRLTFDHTYRPFFNFDSDSVSFSLGDIVVFLVARDADRLSDAMRFHFDAGGFNNIPTARAAGDRLRRSLLMLNAALDLRLDVPTEDQQRVQHGQLMKADYLKCLDKILLDTIRGLHVYPDDGRHVERITAGHADNYPTIPDTCLSS